MRYLDALYKFISEDLNEFFGMVVAFFGRNKWIGVLLGILLALIVLIAILSAIYRKTKGKYLEKLVYTRAFSVKEVYAGDTVTLTETIYNPTFFPFFRIDVEEYFLGGLWLDGQKPDGTAQGEEQEPIISRFMLMPFMQTKRRHEVFCEKRGHYQISTVCVVRKSDPFFIHAPADIYVFPRFIDPMINSFPVSCLLGEYTSKRRLIQDPFSFSGIREYRFGDPMSAINYKATARHPVISSSDIMVNMKDYCTGRIFMIYLNFHLQNAGKSTYDRYEELMEYGLSVSAALIRDAVANGCKVGFAGNCPTETERFIRYPQLSSDEHYKQILQGFACLRISDGISVKLLLQDDIDAGLNNAEIIFLTTYMDDEIDDRLRILKQYSNAVSVIHIKEEDLEE